MTRETSNLTHLLEKVIEGHVKPLAIESTEAKQLIVLLATKLNSLRGKPFDVDTLWDDTQLQSVLKDAFVQALNAGQSGGRLYPYSQIDGANITMSEPDTATLRAAIEEAFSPAPSLESLTDPDASPPEQALVRTDLDTNQVVQRVAEAVGEWLRVMKASARYRDLSFNKTVLPGES